MAAMDDLGRALSLAKNASAPGDMVLRTSDSIVLADSTAVTGGVVYAVNQPIGGLRTLPVLRQPAGSVVLQSLAIMDMANAKAPMDIVLLSAAPANTPADKTTWTLNTADLGKVIGRVSVLASDYVSVLGRGIAQKAGLGILLQGSANYNNLYAVAVSNATLTYSATTDLLLDWGFLRD